MQILDFLFRPPQHRSPFTSPSSLFSILKCSFPESRNFGLPFPNIDAASGDCKMSANKIIRLLERGNSSLEIKGKQKM